MPSSKRIAKAKQIAAAAKKLLRHLKIYDYRDAEDAIIRATERIGRLAEIFDGIDAAAFLARQATDAAGDVKRLSRLLPSGYLGETAENDWIAAMMSLYEKITSRKARTSVGAPSRSDEGKASSDSIPGSSRETIGHQIFAGVMARRVRDNKTGGRRRK